MKQVRLCVLSVALVTGSVLAQTATHPYALLSRASQASAPVAIVQTPEWFLKLPPNTDEMIFAAGTATSTDEQMAYDKARMFAEQRLIEMLSSKIQTQTLSNRVSAGDAVNNRFETMVKKSASGELIGAERVDSQITHDGRAYKVYVLLRLALGEANTLVRERNTQLNLKESANPAQQAVPATPPALKPTLQPEPDKVEPKTEAVAQPVAQGEAKPTEIKLLNVDNEDYKRRRDEALQKPGAVIGHVTVE